MSTHWSSLAKVPFKYFSKPFKINENEFVIAPSTDIQKSKSNDECIEFGIHKYDEISNEWETIIKYEQDSNHYVHGCTINESLQLLYVYECSYEIFIYNLNENKLQRKIGGISFSWYPQLFHHQNQINIIGGDPTRHVTIDEETEEATEIFSDWDFGPDFDVNGNEICLEQHSIIHVKSQNKYLLFGGCHGDNIYFDTVFEFPIKDYPASKWNRLDTKMPVRIASFGTVITADDRYIILFGGDTSFEVHQSYIHVFDTKFNTFYQSKVKCPEPERYRAIITGDLSRDDLCCFGYIRQCCKLNELKDIKLIPVEIIEMITKWIYCEEVHLVAWHTGKHWKTNLNDILVPC